MKKALIDILMLGAFLFTVIIVYIATVSDDSEARKKVYSLEKLTRTSVKALGNYYLFIEQNKNDAEEISNSILAKTSLGLEAKPLINYTWDEVSRPKKVTASISNYQHDNFWYRFLDLNFFTLQVSSVGILDNGEVTDFVPIVVNGCSQTFKEGDEFDYLLKSYDLYDENDNVGFFGAYDPSGGQSSFAHLKNLVKDVMAGRTSNFDLDESLNVATVDSSSIENDVKQIAQSFAIASFTNTKMSIVEAQCGSTADNLIIERVFEITMKGVYCGNGCINPGLTNGCSLTDISGDVFSDISWSNAVNTCNNETFFKITFKIDKIREKGVVLE